MSAQWLSQVLSARMLPQTQCSAATRNKNYSAIGNRPDTSDKMSPPVNQTCRAFHAIRPYSTETTGMFQTADRFCTNGSRFLPTTAIPAKRLRIPDAALTALPFYRQSTARGCQGHDRRNLREFHWTTSGGWTRITAMAGDL